MRLPPQNSDFIIDEEVVYGGERGVGGDDDSSGKGKCALALNGVFFGLKVVKKGIDFILRNGQLTHATPIPPCSDVAELEYVSALHQCDSMARLRQDGSITSREIATYLRSRHGMDVTPKLVQKIVLENGLTADKDEDAYENDDSSEGSEWDHGGAVMDLVELTSALIIPTLLRLRRKKLDELRVRRSANIGAMRLLMSVRMGSVRLPQSQQNDLQPDKEKKESTLLDNVDILRDTLSSILEDCTGDSKPKKIDQDLIRDILRGYGEGALAEDNELIKEMIEVAGGCGAQVGFSEESTSPLLNLDSFVEALTMDVARKYDPDRDERCSTNFQDVWHHSIHDERRGIKGATPEDVENGNSQTTKLVEQKLSRKFKLTKLPRWLRKCCRKEKDDDVDFDRTMTLRRLFTFQSIDYTVDNYRSRWFVILLWFSFVSFWLAYLSYGSFGFGDAFDVCGNSTDSNSTGPNSTDPTGAESEKVTAVRCPLVSGIVNQLFIIGELIIFGTPFICLGSLGNSIDQRASRRAHIIAIALFAAFVLTFYFAEFEVKYWISTIWAPQSLHSASITFGMTVVVIKLVDFFVDILAGRNSDLQSVANGNTWYESKIKRSALFKVDRMLCDAHEIQKRIHMKKSKSKLNVTERSQGDDGEILSNFGMALNEYFKIDGKLTYLGGIAWTWKRILNGTLFTEEGIWISARIAVGTVTQVCVIIAAPIIFQTVVFPLVKENYFGGGDEVGYRTRIATNVGSFFSVLVSVVITVLFIPNIVATTLKFRRGVLQSLRSEDFLHRYRFALDQVALVYGGMFWGVLFSSVAIGVLTGGFVFLILWESTSGVVLNLIGNLLGLSVILVAKIIMSQIMRFTFFAAFYRRMPFAGNIFTIIVEVYSIAISVWFMLVRTIKITVLAALYLGRIDTPLFASGVGIFGPLEIDNWPTVTRKEILIHEAHRHPYIETLGYLYMMQLRFRGGFAKRACSAWRLIFVLALMPWLHKYRDLTRPEHFGKEEKDDQNEEDNLMLMARGLQSAPSDRPQLQRKQTARFMKQPMVGLRHKASNRDLLLGVIGDISESESNDESDPTHGPNKNGNETADHVRIADIKKEMERLKKELATLESKQSLTRMH